VSVFKTIISRLHGVFDKNPYREPVISITSNDEKAMVSVGSQRLTGTGGLSIDLSTMTLQALVTEINLAPGYGATLTHPEYAQFLAKGLLTDGIHNVADDPSLYLSDNQLWAEMQTYAWMLEEQSQRLQQLSKQLYFHSADTDWLEYWARDHFGYQRDGAEPDKEYLRRAVQEIVAPNQNNVAMENMIEKAIEGSFCQIKDSAADPDRLIEGVRPLTWFQVLVGFDLNESEFSFEGKYEQAIAIIKRAKAAGTRIEYLELAGHLKASPAKMAIGAAIAITEVIEVFPSSNMAFEDYDDIITEAGDDLMK
jgi:hypothetical protein